MRKLRIIEQISVDGVIQAPGGPNEGGDDYPHGGWAMLYSDPAILEAIVAAQGKSFDLLLGRRTYDIFAGHWPNARSGPLADGLNAATKYVATKYPTGQRASDGVRPRIWARTSRRVCVTSSQRTALP